MLQSIFIENIKYTYGFDSITDLLNCYKHGLIKGSMCLIATIGTNVTEVSERKTPFHYTEIYPSSTHYDSESIKNIIQLLSSKYVYNIELLIQELQKFTEISQAVKEHGEIIVNDGQIIPIKDVHTMQYQDNNITYYIGVKELC